MAGEKSIYELCEKKIIMVTEYLPDKFTENNGKKWTTEEIDSDRKKNPTHVFICIHTLKREEQFGFDHRKIYSKTGNVEW